MARTRIAKDDGTPDTEQQDLPPHAPTNELEQGHVAPPTMVKDGVTIPASPSSVTGGGLPPLVATDGVRAPRQDVPVALTEEQARAAPPPPKQYRVQYAPPLVSINGFMCRLVVGKLIDERHYNIAKLLAAGVKLVDEV